LRIVWFARSTCPFARGVRTAFLMGKNIKEIKYKINKRKHKS